jgi:site-specific DNA recombinase
VDAVHRMLTRPTYIGRHEFNKRTKAKTLNPADQIVVVPVPPLIDQEMFDAVQAHLKSRNPKVAPPQVVGGPTMLTGICFCADCGGAMTIRTGKSGRCRYYTCSTAARQGETGCKGRSIPMDRLDDLVAQHLETRLLDPERLEEVLASVLDRRQERAERRADHAIELRKKAAEAEARLKRLYDAIESGVADLGDDSLKERIAELRALKAQAQADEERAKIALEGIGAEITPDKLRSFAAVARRRLRGPDGGYRRDHLRALAQRVEVAEGEVRIMGSPGNLLRTLAAASGVASAGAVPSFVPNWRTGWDSNPRYRCRYTGFRDRRLQPLGHLSIARPVCSARRVVVARCGCLAQLRADRNPVLRSSWLHYRGFTLTGQSLWIICAPPNGRVPFHSYFCKEA